ncbi:hypothetical protein V2H45_23500 [Tumidithrix elongata RA019]|uniref:DUF975 family protein n=1 Tax=Tumidithrix elongata BACA0141 TaxID=2716417 RepID=A0AAW9Q3L1_9CYAN|nr:hypothetical protein [Tumidithrix elongata RA019]
MANQPESVSDAGKKVYPRMWTFFLAGLEVGLRLFGLYFLFSFAGGIVAGVLSIGSRSPLNQSPIFFVIIIVVIVGLVWYYTRWSISEVPLAVETELSSSQGVQRSWDLTAAAVGRVQLIVFVAFLVTIPIQAVTNYLPSYFLRLIPVNSFAFWMVYIVNLLISLLGGVIVLPFWQSIKAVMYYDLRSRREGIDLQLRDR